MLARYWSVQSLSPAPQRNIRNIQQWFIQNNGAIVDYETSFIEHTEELIAFSQPKAALRRWFEDRIMYPTRHRLRLFRSATRGRDDGKGTTYVFNDNAVDDFGAVAVFAAAIAMLIAPLWILKRLENLDYKLAVITSFLFVFLLFLTSATLGRPFERLAATAGYESPPRKKEKKKSRKEKEPESSDYELTLRPGMQLFWWYFCRRIERDGEEDISSATCKPNSKTRRTGFSSNLFFRLLDR